jgi:hypothetical protein
MRRGSFFLAAVRANVALAPTAWPPGIQGRYATKGETADRSSRRAGRWRLPRTTRSRSPIGCGAASDDRRPDGADQRVVLRSMIARLLHSISSNSLMPQWMRCRSARLSARSRLHVAIPTIAAWWTRAARRSNSGVVRVGNGGSLLIEREPDRSLSHRRSLVMMALTSLPDSCSARESTNESRTYRTRDCLLRTMR